MIENRLFQCSGAQAGPTLSGNVIGSSFNPPPVFLLSVVTNQDMEKMVDTSHEWIVSRTGISERRLAHQDEVTSDMGTAAAQKALLAAKIKPEQLDLILVSTMTPDYSSPSTAALIQHKLAHSRSSV